MKTIGVIDYYISEWHANNYPKWLAQVAQEGGSEYKIAYAWAEVDKSPVTGVTTDEWCREYGAERCATIEEVCEKADVLMILAPDHCHKHLEYARRVFPCRKPVYVDKTFASSYEDAQAIFALAEQYGTNFFSSSALRYAAELQEFSDVQNAVVTGTVGIFPEYLVHQTEMAVKLLKSPALRVRVDGSGRQWVCRVEAEGNKTATLLCVRSMPYGVTCEDSQGNSKHRTIVSEFFPGLLADIVRFFDTGEVSFDVAETLEVMRIRDAILRGEEDHGTWISVKR